VGNGVIGRSVISQKRMNFGMKRNCKIQGKMGCNGLGNRFGPRFVNDLRPDVANVLHPFGAADPDYTQHIRCLGCIAAVQASGQRTSGSRFAPKATI
jgi:hypothetical protein